MWIRRFSATDDDDLLLRIASSIERRLYRAAISPRAYLALSTLEFRITALATAVLIHSDYDGVGCEDDSRTVSSMCARLSAAARRSLVYCVMVLVSFEMQIPQIETEGGMSPNGLGESWQQPNSHQDYQLEQD